jgi:large subunit ribosomal protein L21
MTYAIIGIGGKQYRVREGERLLVDRLPYDEGKTFSADVLMLGGDGDPKVGADEVKGAQVTARVAAHVLGEKVIVGKHRRRTGYRRRKGHRSRLSQIEIQSIGQKKASRARATKKSDKAEAK